jgi:hypothetical protein
MSKLPSIKGSVYANAHEDVNKLLADGVLTREEATRWLEPSDFDALAGAVNVASWYDVRSYDRLSRLLCDVEGNGEAEYLREKGRRTARRLIEMGLYSQMEYLQRTQVVRYDDPVERFEAFGRDLRRLNTLSASILSFTKWNAVPDPEVPGRYRIEVSEAADMPESLAWRTDGFVNEMAAVHASRDLWAWRRERPDLIVYRMTRDI